MRTYVRTRIPGDTYFFLADRDSTLLIEGIDALRRAGLCSL